jgi:hypothetical protein
VRPLRPVLAFLTAFVALAFLASAAVVGRSAFDRWSARAPSGGLPAAEAAAEAQPSAAALHRLARARARAGDADGAASAALSAARLAPNDAALRAAADRALDAALRAKAARVAMPFLALSGAFLALRGASLARARRRRRRALDAIAAARGTVVATAQGSGQRPGALRPGAASLVLDVHLGTALGDLRPPPPITVALSHAGVGRSVRLTPVREYAGTAVRVRVSGSSLDEVLRFPGRWRVLVRSEGLAVAEGEVLVEGARAPSASPRGAARSAA